MDLINLESEIWNLSSVCVWVASCCLKSPTIQIWNPKSEIWNLSSVCEWVIGCCLKSQTIQIWNPKSEIWIQCASGWLVVAWRARPPYLKSEIWNLKFEFDGWEAGVLPTNQIKISDFRFQIWILKSQKSEIWNMKSEIWVWCVGCRRACLKKIAICWRAL